MAGPHQQGAPGRSVGRPRTASVTAIVIDTSALMAERERHGIAATEVEGRVPWSGVNPEACDLIAAW